MNKSIYSIFIGAATLTTLSACQEGYVEGFLNTPTKRPDATATVVEDDKDLQYNGIKLPDVWPPQRDYKTEIRNGMTPFYLEEKPKVINVNVGRQLFVDDFLIASTSLQRKYYYPEYVSNNPVLSPVEDWELKGTHGGFAAPFSDGVWYDEKDQLFKMWYLAAGGTYKIDEYGVTCYAVSKDGIVWEKPKLNVVSGTNIVRYNTKRDASSMWLDKQETDANKRYKLFEVAGGAGKWKYNYLTSADGKQWQEQNAPSGAIVDRSTVFKNPFRNVWAWSMRHNVRVNKGDKYTIRARDYMENADPMLGNQAAKAQLSSFWFGPWKDELKHPNYNNDDGSPGIYNLDAIPYESIMLGQFTIWQGPENDVAAKDNVIKRNQVMIGYSRDGYSWYRKDMNPFLPVNDDATTWNNGNVQSVVGSPLIVGDKLYFYVSGRRLSGTAEFVSTGLATLRRDGFVSMSGSGELTTEKLKFDGDYLFVNATVRGSLAVELLDENDNVIKGFAKDDCVTIKGDQTKQIVKWKNNSSLKNLKNKLIKIKFYSTDADLYAFWISPWESGESRGYTAGGGPNLNVKGIDTK